MTTSFEILVQEKGLSIEKDGLEIKSVINSMIHFTQSLVVDSEQAFKSVTSMYRMARDYKKVIEEQRKSAVDPFLRQQRAINDKAKEFIDPLNKIEGIAKQKADDYQKHLEMLHRQKEEELKAAAALFDAQDTVYVPPLESSIRGDGAMAYTKIEKKFRLVDLSKVPAKYLMLNEEAIKKDIKLGIEEIPGVEIYEEKTTKLRSR